MDAMAGTTEPQLSKKLGIRDGNNVVVFNAPQRFSRVLDRAEAVQVSRVSRHLRALPVDVAVLFVDRVEDLERRFPEVTARLHPHGGLWVAWPRHRGDVTEVMVRRIALAAGMVHTRGVEFDQAWVGVRLVSREENRDAVAYRAAPPPKLTAAARVRRPTARARRTTASGGAGSALARARARASK